MARLYTGGDEQGCPGEDNCDVFKSSAPDAEVRCPSCPLRSENSEQEVNGSNIDAEGIVDQVQRMVQERNAGFGLPADLTQLEKELIIVWDETIAAYNRTHQMQVNQLFQQLMGMTRR